MKESEKVLHARHITRARRRKRRVKEFRALLNIDPQTKLMRMRVVDGIEKFITENPKEFARAMEEKLKKANENDETV